MLERLRRLGQLRQEVTQRAEGVKMRETTVRCIFVMLIGWSCSSRCVEIHFIEIPSTRKATVLPENEKRFSLFITSRFYDPIGGNILLDERDVKEYDLSWLRAHIGLVGQVKRHH